MLLIPLDTISITCMDSTAHNDALVAFTNMFNGLRLHI